MNIVITGGTKGIGKAIAEKFAKEGFNIAICARTKRDLIRVKKDLKKINSKFFPNNIVDLISLVKCEAAKIDG